MDGIHVIAAIGTRHRGDYARAVRLVEIAASAGADAVRLDIVHPEALMLPVAPPARDDVPAPENEDFDRAVETMLSQPDFESVFESAKELGLRFGCGVYDEGGIVMAERLGADFLAIDAGDINYSRLLRRAGNSGREVILSTGMATLAEIEMAVETIWRVGLDDLTLLHCVSIDPAPLERMNLAFIDVLAQAFGLPVGLADQTGDGLAAAIVAGKGVACLERHLALDWDEKPTEKHALSPDAFANYVSDLRRCEAACRWRRPKVGEVERDTMRSRRRGLYAAREIAEGERLTAADILTVRPAGPMEPNEIEHLIGKVVRRVIHRFEPFVSDMVVTPWHPESQKSGRRAG